MKKYFIIIVLFSLFACNDKYYSDSTEFIEIEKKAKISSSKAFEIYKNTFDKNFEVDKKPYDIESLYQIIYIYEGFYYIGFVSRYDKRDRKEAPLYFLAKINLETGEISVVK